jgi:hypothetical protein
LSAAATSAADQGTAHQVTRPQPVQKSRQIILEWTKAPRATEAAPAPGEQAASVYAQPLGR